MEGGLAGTRHVQRWKLHLGQLAMRLAMQPWVWATLWAALRQRGFRPFPRAGWATIARRRLWVWMRAVEAAVRAAMTRLPALPV